MGSLIRQPLLKRSHIFNRRIFCELIRKWSSRASWHVLPAEDFGTAAPRQPCKNGMELFVELRSPAECSSSWRQQPDVQYMEVQSLPMTKASVEGKPSFIFLSVSMFRFFIKPCSSVSDIVYMSDDLVQATAS
jgi:hypothetical protein